MTLKRIILSILTLVALVPIVVSLISSFQEPQVQTDLQLYQTNLILQGSQLDVEQFDIPIPRDSLLGKDTEKLAQKQYKDAQKSLSSNLERLTEQSQELLKQIKEIDPDQPLLYAPLSQINKKIEEQTKNLNQVNLNLGIIQASKNQLSQAIETWNKVELINDPTQKSLASILQIVWQNPQSVTTQQEQLIDDHLSGWFRYQVLFQLYQSQGQNDKLSALNRQEQTLAIKAINKLLIVTSIPFISGGIGVILLLFVLIQRLLKKEQSILAINEGETWKVPWEFETTWQVLIVGFFLVSQILLPIVFSLFDIQVAQLSLRLKAVYVLVSYLGMTTGGLLVLYLSIKSFFPLPSDWFNFKLNFKDLLWGLGGYLVALPLVILVSLFNQQIWQGQGGSNPLLSLALESQDFVVLAIFFFTASIAAPFFEEMMFRGFLLPSLTRYISVGSAIFISGLIFAFAHLNLSEVLPLLTLGTILGFVYTRSRNLLSSMLLHSLWNSGTLLSLFILGSSGN